LKKKKKKKKKKEEEEEGEEEKEKEFMFLKKLLLFVCLTYFGFHLNIPHRSCVLFLLTYCQYVTPVSREAL